MAHLPHCVNESRADFECVLFVVLCRILGGLFRVLEPECFATGFEFNGPVDSVFVSNSESDFNPGFLAGIDKFLVACVEFIPGGANNHWLSLSSKNFQRSRRVSSEAEQPRVRASSCTRPFNSGQIPTARVIVASTITGRPTGR